MCGAEGSQSGQSQGSVYSLGRGWMRSFIQGQELSLSPESDLELELTLYLGTEHGLRVGLRALSGTSVLALCLGSELLMAGGGGGLYWG